MQLPLIQENPSISPQKNLWSPLAIGWISLLFTPIPAAVMMAINYGRSGKQEKQKLWFFYAIVGALIYCLLMFRVSLASDSQFTGSARLPLLVFYVAIAWSFYRRQSPLFENHVRQGGKKSSVLVPVLGSMLWFGLASGIGIGGELIVQARDNREIDRAFALMREGDDLEAEVIFKRIKRKYPDDIISRYNLAVIYVNTERYSLAKWEIQQILQIAPEDKDARDFLKELQIMEGE